MGRIATAPIGRPRFCHVCLSSHLTTRPNHIFPAFSSSRRLAGDLGGARLVLTGAKRLAVAAAGTIGRRIATNPKTGTSVVAVRANSVGACRCCTARNLRNRGSRHCARRRSLETFLSLRAAKTTRAADYRDRPGRWAARRGRHRNATLSPSSFTPPKRNSTG